MKRLRKKHRIYRKVIRWTSRNWNVHNQYSILMNVANCKMLICKRVNENIIIHCKASQLAATTEFIIIISNFASTEKKNKNKKKTNIVKRKSRIFTRRERQKQRNNKHKGRRIKHYSMKWRVKKMRNETKKNKTKIVQGVCTLIWKWKEYKNNSLIRIMFAIFALDSRRMDRISQKWHWRIHTSEFPITQLSLMTYKKSVNFLEGLCSFKRLAQIMLFAN